MKCQAINENYNVQTFKNYSKVKEKLNWPKKFVEGNSKLYRRKSVDIFLYFSFFYIFDLLNFDRMFAVTKKAF